MLTKDIVILFILLIISIIFIIVGTKLFNDSKRLSRMGVRTTGTIVETLSKQQMNFKQTSSYKVVEFADKNGRTIQFTGKVGLSSYGDMQIGKSVVVLYDPNNPEIAAIDDFKERELPWMIVLFVGIGLFLVSFSILIYTFLKNYY